MRKVVDEDQQRSKGTTDSDRGLRNCLVEEGNREEAYPRRREQSSINGDSPSNSRREYLRRLSGSLSRYRRLG